MAVHLLEITVEFACMCVNASVCVCVREIERVNEREKGWVWRGSGVYVGMCAHP